MPSGIVVCHECQTKLKIPDTISAGKKIRCPKCKTPIEVPGEDEDTLPARSAKARPASARKAPLPLDEDDEAGEVLPPRKPAKRRQEEDEDERPTRRPVQQREGDEEDEEDQPARKAGRGRDLEEDQADEDGDRPKRKESKRQKKSKGNPVLAWGLIIGGVVLLGGGITAYFIMNQGTGGQPGTNNPNESQSEWTPDPTLVSQLDDEVAIEQYRIRPPKGFKYEARLKDKEAHQIVAFYWSAGPKLLGAVAHCTAVINWQKPKVIREKSLEEQLASYLNSQKSIHDNFESTNVEKGKVNGLAFMRVRFTGIHQRTKAKCQGVAYVTRDGENNILSHCVDSEGNDARFKLMEAALLTFRKP